MSDRKSRLYLVRRVESKKASIVKDAIIDMLKSYKNCVYTITLDNGGEDKYVAQVEKALNFRRRKCLAFKQPAVVFDELRQAG